MKFFACLCLLLGGTHGIAVAAPPQPIPGRLFYTPAQRAILVNARTHKVTVIQKSVTPPATAPLRLDGVITRSDGVTTHWINGRAHVGRPSLPDLKPGQTRAQQQVYEPYQLRPSATLPQALTPSPANGTAP